MIPATLTLAETARLSVDVLVVGSGPAGALAAGLVAAAGRRVLLVDRAALPRPKVCGSCLSGRALSALAAAGLADLPARLGAVPLGRLILSGGGHTAELSLPGGAALSRPAFDAALAESAIARGAHFLPATRAVWLEAGRVLLCGEAGEVEVWPRVVLAADGLAGGFTAGTGLAAPPRPGSRIGAGATFASAEPFYRSGAIYMCCGDAGYVGLVRLEDGQLDVACAFDLALVRRAGGPAQLVAATLARSGWPVPDGLSGAAWRGTPPLTRRAVRVAGRGLFLLGDATGYVEPFTGEGMAWALGSAVALAPLAGRAAAGWDPTLGRAWARLHRRLVTRRQTVCRLAAAVLRRGRLAAVLVAVLSWLPGLAAPVVAHLNRPFTPGALR